VIFIKFLKILKGFGIKDYLEATGAGFNTSEK
jgi:hypothetical protein